MVDPPTTSTHLAEPPLPPITLTPTKSTAPVTTPSPSAAAAVLEETERIEVPCWVMVKAGEDDEEEARDELLGGTQGVSKIMSPVKRLRKVLIGDEVRDPLTPRILLPSPGL